MTVALVCDLRAQKAKTFSFHVFGERMLLNFGGADKLTDNFFIRKLLFLFLLFV